MTSKQSAAAAQLAPEFLEFFTEEGTPKPAAFYFSQLDENPRLSWLRRHPINSKVRCWIRESGIRLMDVCLSMAALIFLTPLLLLLIVLIPLESPGSPFFTQIRAGRAGRVIRMFKLRSMRVNSDRGGIKLATKDDDRLTRIGKLIRRTRIDELPQFVNVIKGEMSIVGPRPEIPAIAILNQRRIPDYEDRHAMRPGITGLAQILNGYDQDVDAVRRTVALDKYWVQHHGIRNYVRTLFRTVPVVFWGRGAL